MYFLSGQDEIIGQKWLNQAAKIALRATCERSKCGCVIVSNNECIGIGCNTPPKSHESQRRCSCSKDGYHKKVTDKTCCIHAEQRAILDALRNHPDKINGSRLYFIRLDEENKPSFAGKPYCTICSKMALDVGIAEFVLSHQEGICVYNTEEYNDLSYQYSE
ncbi:MAG: hypothetical protein U0518_05745 [Candidatus Gracilibacteria bacterium]